MTAVDQRPPIKNLIAERRGASEAPYEDVCAVKALLVQLRPVVGHAAGPPLCVAGRGHGSQPAKGLIMTLEDRSFEDGPGGRLSSTHRSLERGEDQAGRRRRGEGAGLVPARRGPCRSAPPSRPSPGPSARPARACDIPFVFELLVYPLPGDGDQTTDYVEHRSKNPELVLESVRAPSPRRNSASTFSSWKARCRPQRCPTRTVAAAAVQDLFDEMGRLAGRPWVMLSAGPARTRSTGAALRLPGRRQRLSAGRAIWWRRSRPPTWTPCAPRRSTTAWPIWKRINALTDAHATPGTHALWRRCRAGRRGRVRSDGLSPISRDEHEPTQTHRRGRAGAAHFRRALRRRGRARPSPRWTAWGPRPSGRGTLLFDAAQAEAAVEALKAEPLDLLLILQVTFTDATMTVPLARRSRRRSRSGPFPNRGRAGACASTRCAASTWPAMRWAGRGLAIAAYLFGGPDDAGHRAPAARPGRRRRVAGLLVENTAFYLVAVASTDRGPMDADGRRGHGGAGRSGGSAWWAASGRVRHLPLRRRRAGRPHRDRRWSRSTLPDLFDRARAVEATRSRRSAPTLDAALGNLDEMEAEPLDKSLRVYAALKGLAEEGPARAWRCAAGRRCSPTMAAPPAARWRC